MREERRVRQCSFIPPPSSLIPFFSRHLLRALSRCRPNRYNRPEWRNAGPRFLRMRVGIGHDTHRLAPGRPLLLGGVAIPHPRGLVGHSDADVVLHAVTDALLGAAGLGDIGDAYPDTDPAYRDAASSRFVRETRERLQQLGWQIVNLDVIIFAQEPK